MWQNVYDLLSLIIQDDAPCILKTAKIFMLINWRPLNLKFATTSYYFVLLYVHVCNTNPYQHSEHVR